ncbi:MAG: rhodanese-like domain-containing protein [Nitrospira sp.]|nr:rhodanese-like domain-containing protein [Nitrospira sp.]
MKHNPAFLRLVEQARKRITECHVEEVMASLDRGERFHFLDIREDHEFSVDHARGACHLGKGILERDIETVVPDKEAVIVLYCGGGFRSALAADALRQMG